MTDTGAFIAFEIHYNTTHFIIKFILIIRGMAKTCRKGLIRPRGTRKCVPGIGKLRHGLLEKFGYVHVKSLSATQRHAALDKAVKAYGALSVFRKLNAALVYSKYSSPVSSRIFKADRDYIGAKYIH